MFRDPVLSVCTYLLLFDQSFSLEQKQSLQTLRVFLEISLLMCEKNDPKILTLSVPICCLTSLDWELGASGLNFLMFTETFDVINQTSPTPHYILVVQLSFPSWNYLFFWWYWGCTNKSRHYVGEMMTKTIQTPITIIVLISCGSVRQEIINKKEIYNSQYKIKEGLRFITCRAKDWKTRS